MSLYDRALTYATEMHTGQVRKYTGEPYIMHPLEVVHILKRHGFDNDRILSAAILHDVVEDTPATFKDIFSKFGSTVFEYVFWLTDASKPEDGNRIMRKMIDRIHIAGCPHKEVKVIKCADLISNTGSIVQHDPGFAKVYLGEKRTLLKEPGMRRISGDPIYREALELSEYSGV